MRSRCLAAVLVLSAAAFTWPQKIVEFPIQEGTWNSFNPSVSFNTVAWADARSQMLTGIDIWGADLRSPAPFPICQTPLDQIRPRVDEWGGDTLCVWMQTAGANSDIYGRYITSGGAIFPIAVTPDPEANPKCWGRNVVYQRMAQLTANDVWGYLLPSGPNFPIVQAPRTQSVPDIFGYAVVWQDDRSGGPFDIYAKDIRTPDEINLTNSTGPDNTMPAVSGDWVVFQRPSMLTVGNDIYGMRLSRADVPPIPICTAVGDQLYPRIWGNIVVWEDHRDSGTPGHIFGYDLAAGKEFEIPRQPDSGDSEPDVSQNVVVFTHNPGMYSHIWGATLGFSNITGDVVLENYVGDPQAVTLELELLPLGPGNPTTLPVRLDASGRFLATTLLTGTYYVSLKPSHWLRQRLPYVVTLQPGTTVTVGFDLTNGDAWQDNIVDLLDLSTILADFGTVGVDPGDLDGSDMVDLLDLSIVLMNFGQRGDP